MPFTKIFCYFGHFSYPIEEYANPWSSTQTSTSKNTPNSNEMNLCKSKRTTENAPNFYSIIQLHVLCLFQKARKHLLSLGSSCPPLASSEPNRPAWQHAFSADILSMKISLLQRRNIASADPYSALPNAPKLKVLDPRQLAKIDRLVGILKSGNPEP